MTHDELEALVLDLAGPFADLLPYTHCEDSCATADPEMSPDDGLCACGYDRKLKAARAVLDRVRAWQDGAL